MEDQTPDKRDQIGRPLVFSKIGGLAERMQACCEPLGLKNDKAIAGQTWSGEINGRFVQIHASARKRTRYAGEIRYSTYAGHSLEIIVKTPIKTRLVLSVLSSGLMKMASKTNSWFGTKPVATDDPAYVHLDLWASEPAWAEGFLNQTAVRDAVSTLMPADDLPLVVGLRMAPETWNYTQRLSVKAITPDAVEAWVNALLTLAAAAEDSPPMNEVKPTWLERQSPMVAGLTVVGSIVGITLLISFCCVAMMIGASVLLASQ